MIFSASRSRALILTLLNGGYIHAPFVESLLFDYRASSTLLRCLDKRRRKLYEIEFREGTPVGGIALAESVTPRVDTKRVVDLGAGNGIIAIAMATKGCDSVLAVDVSERDCRLATRNVRRNHKEHVISILRSDWAFSFRGRTIDIIISNPPQLPTNEAKFDTKNFAGPTGYEAIDKIIPQSKACLTPAGELWLYVLGFLGVEQSTGALPCLFERLRKFGLHPHVVRKLRRRYSQDPSIQEALPLIQSFYPKSDISRNCPKAGYYEAFVVRASQFASEESIH